MVCTICEYFNAVVWECLVVHGFVCFLSGQFQTGLALKSLSLLAQALSFYKLNQEITDIMDNMDVYILPVMNPDGYHYTWATVRIHIVACRWSARPFVKDNNFNWNRNFPWLIHLRTECGGKTALWARKANASGSTSTETSTPTGAVSLPLAWRSSYFWEHIELF